MKKDNSSDIEKYISVKLNLKTDNDKLLYYKRKLELVEKKIDILPFWNNLFIWIYAAYTIPLLYFIWFITNNSFSKISNNISLIFFNSIPIIFKKDLIYILSLISIINFLLTFGISYILYKMHKEVTYFIFGLNTFCNILIFITLIKILQMNFVFITH